MKYKGDGWKFATALLKDWKDREFEEELKHYNITEISYGTEKTARILKGLVLTEIKSAW